MAKYPLTNAYVSVNGVDLSNRVRSVTVHTERGEIDVTTMGSAFMDYVGGIPDANIDVEYLQDHAAGSVDAVHWPLVGSNTTFTVEVRPVNSARSATNPGFTMTSLLLGPYEPIAGSVGDASSTSVTYRNASQTGIQRLTA